MTDTTGSKLTFLLKAVAFSADHHRSQRRNDAGKSPYVNHPLDVAYLLASVGGVTDATSLAAAVLHDTLVDTSASPEELETQFGPDVRQLVEEVTDHTGLDLAERKRPQTEPAAILSPVAKVLKLGDMIANSRDVIEDPPSDWTRWRRLEYLDWAEQVVAGCRGTNEPLERRFDELLQQGRETLAREAPPRR